MVLVIVIIHSLWIAVFSHFFYALSTQFKYPAGHLRCFETHTWQPAMISSKTRWVKILTTINVLHIFLCTCSHTPAQQVLAVHVCRPGSFKMACAVMIRWLLEEIAASWKNTLSHTHTHTHTHTGTHRCLTVKRDAVTTGGHLQLTQHQTTANWNHTHLAIKLITLVDCSKLFASV